MKQIFFVRHGQTEWNAIRRMQGQWNSNLNELGREQADVNGRFLQQFDIQHAPAIELRLALCKNLSNRGGLSRN